ncbi:hypothetical protein GCM10023323_32560 [Streptomyces thinghirensis]|uniref:Uncharacterized protein n=1 Tax=Streptomyces thinghirensis TaxID=551547 RepID=A0ABP9T2C7_9ACTN
MRKVLPFKVVGPPVRHACGTRMSDMLGTRKECPRAHRTVSDPGALHPFVAFPPAYSNLRARLFPGLTHVG